MRLNKEKETADLSLNSVTKGFQDSFTQTQKSFSVNVVVDDVFFVQFLKSDFLFLAFLQRSCQAKY